MYSLWFLPYLFLPRVLPAPFNTQVPTPCHLAHSAISFWWLCLIPAMQILLQLCSGKNVIVPTYRFFILPLDSVTEKKILMKILMVHYYDLG